MTDERCQRCGDMGQDRRNLWMACGYAMEEMDIPFKRLSVHGQVFYPTGMKDVSSFMVPVWPEPDPDVESHLHQYYKLRVCKDCRADWMRAIRDWFNSVPDHLVPDAPEADISVRIDGAVRMFTLEQYYQFKREGGK